MITLSQATDDVKILIKWGGVVFGIIILIFFLFNMLVKALPQTPPQQAPPKAPFGTLPTIPFPEPTTTEKLLYKIDTLSGLLPATGKQPDEIPDRMHVFRISQPSPSLISLNRTQEAIKRLGIVAEGVKLSESEYEWLEETPPFRKVTVDIFSSNFSLTSQYMTESSVIFATNLPSSVNDATRPVDDLLAIFSVFPNDIDKQKTTVERLSIAEDQLVAAPNQESTQLYRVNYFQVGIEEVKQPPPTGKVTPVQEPSRSFPIVYPHPPSSIMSFLVAGGQQKAQVVEAEYVHQNITVESGDYPIKTAQQAWEELESGKGYIASNARNAKTVLVKSIYLAYYLGTTQQEYLMPVFVFDSEDGFLAYVSAIANNWIGKP